jgi:hypothetical protein
MSSNPEDSDVQYRAVFKADVTFSKHGGLQAERFRVDLPSSSATAEEIGRLFVRSLDLLLAQTMILLSRMTLHCDGQQLQLPGETKAEKALYLIRILPARAHSFKQYW